MKVQGFIYLHRSIINSDIYQMPPLYLRVFERLILEANHKDVFIPYKEKSTDPISKKLIKRGERLTTIRDIAEWVSWYERGKLKIPNPKTIISILDWLKKNDMIKTYDLGNKKGTHYSIVNYDTYQTKDSDKSNKKETDSKQSLALNNNDNNDNNIYASDFEKFWSIYPRCQAKQDTFKHFCKLAKEKGSEYILQCTENYLNYYNSLDENSKQYAYSSNNFLGKKQYYLDYEKPKVIPLQRQDQYRKVPS